MVVAMNSITAAQAPIHAASEKGQSHATSKIRIVTSTRSG